MVHNDPQHVNLRRYQNTLSVVGTGIILFAAWSVVKVFGTVFLGADETIRKAIDTALESQNILTKTQLYIMAFLFMLIFMSVEVAIRIYVGLSARAEARGQRCSSLFIFLTVLMMAGSLLTIVTTIMNTGSDSSTASGTMISTVIIEATSLIMMAEMIAAAVRIRRLTGSGKHSIHLEE